MTEPFAFRTERDIVTVSGPDAERYLQGQLSQDVEALAVATSTHTFVLEPQGRVDAWARITRTAADAFVLDTDSGAGEELVGRLRRFLIRTRAEVEPGRWPAVVVRGDAPRGEVPEGVLRVAVAGAGVDGYDLIGPGAEVPDGIQIAGADEYDAYRVEHGVPVMGREVTSDTIPAELGAWAIDASVSFTKGCYTGQELTARIDSRGGNVPHRIRVLALEAPVADGDEVIGDGGKGTVTTAAVSGRFGPIALARCARGLTPGDRIQVGGTIGTVHDAPLG